MQFNKILEKWEWPLFFIVFNDSHLQKNELLTKKNPLWLQNWQLKNQFSSSFPKFRICTIWPKIKYEFYVFKFAFSSRRSSSLWILNGKLQSIQTSHTHTLTYRKNLLNRLLARTKHTHDVNQKHVVLAHAILITNIRYFFFVIIIKILLPPAM